VVVIFGSPGKLTAKRSSLAAKSAHSCANDVPDIANTKADEMSGIRRMIEFSCGVTGFSS
jgi:hypothetical protein